MYPLRITELEVTSNADASDGLASVTIIRNTYEVTGRGARNRTIVDVDELLTVGRDKISLLVAALLEELGHDDVFEVIGGPATPAVKVESLPLMTRDQAASLIGELARVLV